MPKLTVYRIKGTTEWLALGKAAAFRLLISGVEYVTKTL
jgi:hypothetical protein